MSEIEEYSEKAFSSPLYLILECLGMLNKLVVIGLFPVHIIQAWFEIIICCLKLLFVVKISKFLKQYNHI